MRFVHEHEQAVDFKASTESRKRLVEIDFFCRARIKVLRVLVGDLPSKNGEHEDAEECPGCLGGFGVAENLEVEEGAPEEVRDVLHDCGC